MPRTDQPLAAVHWVDPALLTANDYNPNQVFKPELDLLRLSLLEDGWTQPIVATMDNVIVDGFHRWTLASNDDEVRALGDGCVPVVFVSKDRDERIMSTVRHNRARGQHAIMRMASLVIELADTLDHEELGKRLGMEQEEIDRLLHAHRPSTDTNTAGEFGKGWVPDGD